MRYFEITTTDKAKLNAYSDAFHDLYIDKGPDAPLDWSEVHRLLSLAADGLGPKAHEFLSECSPLNPARPTDLDDVALSFPDTACEQVRSAAALVYSYRRPEDVNLEDLDAAFALLAGGDIGHAPDP